MTKTEKLLESVVCLTGKKGCICDVCRLSEYIRQELGGKKK